MPAVHARGTDSADAPALTEPAQRLGDEAGTDKRGIIAMILATLLFIVVISLYQYLSLKWDRMEVEPRPSLRSRSPSTSSQTILSSLTPIMARIEAWWSSLKSRVTRAWPSSESSMRSSFDSTTGLMKPWSLGTAKRYLGFSPPCTSRGKANRRKKQRPASLKPFLLDRPDVVPFQRKDSIDEGDHQDFLRSPLAFSYDIDYSVVNAGGTGKGQRVRFMDEPETPKPLGAYTSPTFSNRENKLHRRTLSHATMNSSPATVVSGLGSPVSNALNVIPPSRARVRDLWLLNPQPSSPDHPSSIGYYSDYQSLDRTSKSHRRRDYRFPCPPTTNEENDDPFIIGDISDRDSSIGDH